MTQSSNPARPDGTEPPAATFVDVTVVQSLRHAVLRPGRPAGESAYPGDADPDTAHAAVQTRRGFGPGVPAVSAVGTVLRAPPPWAPQTPGWRIRGMATVKSARGQGLGRLVLDALLEHIARQGGGLVWCNARVKASDFYRRAGFETRGAPFDVRGIGPHVRMWRTVEHAPFAP